MRTILHLFILFLSFTVKETYAQEKRCKKQYDSTFQKEVYVNPDKIPQYPGGDEELVKFISRNLNFPEPEIMQATFIMEFIIDADGKIISPVINKKKKRADMTNPEKAVLDVLKKMPDWLPGECSGKKVPVRSGIPLRL